MSKIDIAKKIYAEHYETASRREILEKMVEAGLTKAGASTYFQNLKKEFNPADVAPVEQKHICKLPNHILVLRETTKWPGYGDKIQNIYFVIDEMIIAYIQKDGPVCNMANPIKLDRHAGNRTFERIENHNYGMDEDSQVVVFPANYVEELQVI